MIDFGAYPKRDEAQRVLVHRYETKRLRAAFLLAGEDCRITAWSEKTKGDFPPGADRGCAIIESAYDADAIGSIAALAGTDPDVRRVIEDTARRNDEIFGNSVR